MPGLNQAETWLEVRTNDLAAAEAHLTSAQVVRCDEIEPLPDGFNLLWIADPASIVHLVRQEEE